MLPTLVGMGFRVIEADASPYMIERAREAAEQQEISEVLFQVTDMFETQFED